MQQGGRERLRVLVADGSTPRLEHVVRSVIALGHDVTMWTGSLVDVFQTTVRESPDVAIVVVSEGTEHGLEVIDEIVREVGCPVIAVIDVEDVGFVREAAKRGIFAYLTGDDTEEIQGSIDVVLRRFAEYHSLEGAFGRRALTERAKGILMERHAIGEEAAFRMLREQARRTQRKIVDIAAGVVSTLPLLPADAPSGPPGDDV